MSIERHKHSDLIIYPTHLISTTVRRCNPPTNERPTHNKHDGFMSYKASKRMKRAIYWMDAITPEFEVKNPTTGKLFKMKLCFVTLTLSAPQMHSDLEIKREMLHPWLVNMVKRFNLNCYAWRAEAQENGNIHFHFVTNKFMHLFVVRRAWNACQRRMGYIEKYRQAQKEFHSTGFTVRKNMLRSWTKEQQERAYKHGVATNWSDPNSTDIHSLQGIDNSAAYCAKYMSKSITGTCPKCSTKKYFSKLPEDTAACKKCGEALILKHDRKIEGRLWFISQSLSQIKACRIPITPVVSAEIFAHNKFSEFGIECSPYASLFLIKPDSIKMFDAFEIRTAYKNFCAETYQRIEFPETCQALKICTGIISSDLLSINQPKKYGAVEQLQLY